MADRQHAKRYAPSASSRWTVCHASAKFTEHMVSESSDYAMDGEEAHNLFAFALQNKFRDAAQARIAMPSSWTHRQDTFNERVGSVQSALDWIWDQLDAYPDMRMYIEQRVDFPSQLTRDCWGHADVVLYEPTMNFIVVPDFKHGAGDWVKAIDNTQIGIYGAAAYAFIKNAIGRPPPMIVMAVIQPRAYAPRGEYVRKWVVSDAFMEQSFIPTIEGHIAKCESDSPAFNPSPEACKYCPAKIGCPAREAAAASAVGENFANVRMITPQTLPQVIGMPVDRLVEIKRKSDMLYDFLKEVDKAIFQLLRSGAEVPGFKLVEAQAKRQWYGSETEVAYELMKLLETQDWDTVFPRKLIGVVDAESLVKKAFRARASKGKKNEASNLATEALATLTLKQSSGNPVLADASDPRPALNIAQATFANVTVIEQSKGS